MKICQIMETEVITLQADAPLMRAAEITASEHVRHLPILDGERLVGIVSLGDIKHVTPSPLVEGNEAEYRRLFRETPVSRIMRRVPITTDPDATLGEVIRRMVENRIGAVPIVRGGKLIGIVSELDILRTFREVLDVLE